MDLIITLLASVISIYLIHKIKHRFIVYVLIYNVVIDIASLFSETGGAVAIIRGFVLFYYFFYCLIKYKENTRIKYVILFYSIFTLILVFFSSRIGYSFRTYTKTIISILYFIVAYSTIKKIEDFRMLLKTVLIIFILLIFNVILANYFGLEGKLYNEEQLVNSGNFSGQKWNLGSYAILCLPLMLYFTKKRAAKVFLYVLAFTVFILIIFNLSRIPLIAILFGYFVFFLFTKQKSVYFKYAVGVLITVTLASPFLLNTVLAQLELRQDRYSLDSYESEARYKETFYVSDEIFNLENPVVMFFGKEFLNSPGNYAGGRWGNRQLHVDYNNLLLGSGVFGLLFYFYIFYSMFLYFKKVKPRFKNSTFINLLITTFYVFFLTQFIISLSGQMYSITFRSFNFIFMGAFLSILAEISRGNITIESIMLYD